MHRAMKAIIIVLITVICFNGCKKPNYISGKDTYLSVGDGRFQLLGYERYDLFDEEKQQCILELVTFYYNDEDHRRLYLKNSNETCMIVDYQNNSYEKYKKKEIPEEVKKQFNSLDMKELKIIPQETNHNDVFHIYD